MAKFRKKPVIIDAIQFFHVHHGNGFAVSEWTQWIEDAYSKRKDEVGCIYVSEGKLYIHTLEGAMEVSEGDYIIMGLKGELYPCKPDIFELSYEKAD